jgi:hypothetical protein
MTVRSLRGCKSLHSKTVGPTCYCDHKAQGLEPKKSRPDWEVLVNKAVDILRMDHFEAMLHMRMAANHQKHSAT